MKILIAPDAFKESLSAIEVCYAIKSGFGQVISDAEYTLLPMADGGEGTAEVLSYALQGRWQKVTVHDPLMRPISAQYLLLSDGTAVIEMAQASGLHLLSLDERDPLKASSYGVGEMIVDALAEGASQIIIGLGGSATNDGGFGMLSALGVRFYDAQGKILPQGGENLINLQQIDLVNLPADITSTIIKAACDVTAPLCGKLGASSVFAPQKGATAKTVAKLDQALSHFAKVCRQQGFGDHQMTRGAGAAGGLGFGLMTFCGAQLQSGFDTVADTLNLSDHIAAADLVITGEGRLDAQTAMGKVAGGVSQIAHEKKTPVVAICGSVDDLRSASASQFDVVLPSIQKIAPIEQVLDSAYDSIETTAANLAAAMRLGQLMRV